MEYSCAITPEVRTRFSGKMADENEDQWLYGDSVDGKDSFPENSDSQPAENSNSYNNQDEPYEQNEDTQGEMENEPPEMQEVT